MCVGARVVPYGQLSKLRPGSEYPGKLRPRANMPIVQHVHGQCQCQCVLEGKGLTFLDLGQEALKYAKDKLLPTTPAVLRVLTL
jgi:hypothetical protein